jgi:hypothetical protein
VTGIEQVREIALSLPEATEEPHFDMTSFRVKGKIFATVPPDETRLHVFVDEAAAEASVAEDPAAFELLRWGQRVAGVRARLDAVDPERVRELLTDSWRRRAPRRLVAGYDQGRPA